MQYQIYIESQTRSSKSWFFNAHTLISAGIVLASLILVTAVGHWLAVTAGITGVAMAIVYFRKHRHQKPLLLQVTESGIVYYCEERNEMVYVLSRDITRINTGFCKLDIHTRDNYTHSINLLNIKSEQTRWEIKEMAKSLAKQVSCELAA